MSHEQTLRRLAQRARQEPTPSVEVSSAVMRRIESAGQPTNRPLAIITGLSATAAAVVLYFAVSAWSSWQDPMTSLLCSVDTVLQ